MVFIGIMAIEADYTFLTRIEFFTESDFDSGIKNLFCWYFFMAMA